MNISISKILFTPNRWTVEHNPYCGQSGQSGQEQSRRQTMNSDQGIPLMQLPIKKRYLKTQHPTPSGLLVKMNGTYEHFSEKNIFNVTL